MLKIKHNRKNILIISLLYYPDNRVGAKRFGNLVNLFSENYADVHVLTIPMKNIPVKDSSLSAAGIIHRAPIFPPYPVEKNNAIKKFLVRMWTNLFCMIDPYSGWVFPAVIKAIKVIRKNKIDVIIATAPPFSVLFAAAITSVLTRRKLIIDYRDPWSNHPNMFPKFYGKTLNKIIEKVTIRIANGAVFCSKIMMTNFINDFGLKTGFECHVITNGYHDIEQELKALKINQEKKTMVFAGNLYGGRNLGIIADAINQLKIEGIINRNNFEFVIFGKTKKKDLKFIKALNLEDFIKVNEPIPYQDALRYIKGADILFLPSANEVKYAVPYKFFDYLMVKKPILAVAPKDSAVADIVCLLPQGFFCPIDNKKQIYRTLKKLVIEDVKLPINLNDNYTWKKLAMKYMDIIQRLP